MPTMDWSPVFMLGAEESPHFRMWHIPELLLAASNGRLRLQSGHTGANTEGAGSSKQHEDPRGRGFFWQARSQDEVVGEELGEARTVVAIYPRKLVRQSVQVEHLTHCAGSIFVH